MVSELLFACSVYKLIPWFVLDSSIQIKLSDPVDQEIATNLEKELMFYCGNHQALQQSQDISRRWKTYSVTTEHASFQASLICTALPRCGGQITKLLDMVREEEGTYRQNHRHARCLGQCWLWYFPDSPPPRPAYIRLI